MRGGGERTCSHSCRAQSEPQLAILFKRRAVLDEWSKARDGRVEPKRNEGGETAAALHRE